MELLRAEDIGLPLEDLIAMAEQSIFRLFANNVPVLVAFSSGKDSSTVANLVLSAARKYVANGGHAVVLVTSSDTLVENPEVAANVRKELDKMEVYARKHGIDLTTKIVYPHLLSTFQVKTLSGRGLPSFAGSSSDCTVYGDPRTVNRWQERSAKPRHWRKIQIFNESVNNLVVNSAKNRVLFTHQCLGAACTTHAGFDAYDGSS